MISGHQICCLPTDAEPMVTSLKVSTIIHCYITIFASYAGNTAMRGAELNQLNKWAGMLSLCASSDKLSLTAFIQVALEKKWDIISQSSHLHFYKITELHMDNRNATTSTKTIQSAKSHMHHQSLAGLCQIKVVSRECARLVNIKLVELLKKTRYLLLADLAQLF